MNKIKYRRQQWLQQNKQQNCNVIKWYGEETETRRSRSFIHICFFQQMICDRDWFSLCCVVWCSCNSAAYCSACHEYTQFAFNIECESPKLKTSHHCTPMYHLLALSVSFHWLYALYAVFHHVMKYWR